jgi:hypothetical protein
MVALDENGKPTPVLPLVAGNVEEQDRIDKARERRKRMKIVEEELSRIDLAEK